MPPILKISDSSTEVNLIKAAGQSGYHLSRWRPAVASYKGGGSWQDSPMADGRRLADKKFELGIESFELKLVGPTQDQAVYESRRLRTLLEKASDYWATDWQDQPVWIEAKGSCETNSRFALVHVGHIPEDENPFAQPFLQADGSAVMDNLTLVVERGPWTACRPGTAACVQASGEQEGWEYGPWGINTNQPIDIVHDIIELQSGRLLATDNSIGSGPWRTDDGGATAWIVPATAPNMQCRCLAEDPGTAVYAVGISGPNLETWRSLDNGVNWARTNAAVGATGNHSLIYAADGYLYLADNTGIRRSNDGGTTWVTVLGTVAAPIYAWCMYQAANGYIYCGASADGRIYRSLNGTNWYLVAKELGERINVILEIGDYLYAGGESGGVFRSPDGSSWNKIGQLPTPTQGIYDLAYHRNYIYAITYAGGDVWRSLAGIDWKHVVDVGDWGQSLQEWSGNNLLYAGEFGDIWRDSPGVTDVGRAATCTDEVYVANKQNVAQLTHVKTYDASAAPPNDYLDRFPAGAFPYQLLPNPMANNDAVYFGIDTGAADAGPFDNVVLDITTPADGTYTVTWQYSDGVAGWPGLNVQDNTDRFWESGVNSVHWVPPDDWAPEAVDGDTCYWVRAIIGNVTGNPIGPQQGNRDPYTVNWPRADVDDAQILGDIPALLRLKFHNQSDEDGYATVDELDLLDNRVVAGLRSMGRGETFIAFLNCADEQNPFGVITAVGTGTAYADEVRTPTGRVATHTTTGNGLSVWDTAFTFTLGPTIARDFYGTYHAYVRAQLYEPSSSPSGDHDDVRVRLRVRSGSGGVARATDYAQFAGRDAWDGAAGREETYKDWQLCDFGQVELPATGLLRADELPDELAIDVEIASAAGTNLRVDLYDLVLVPVDEWAGDFVDHAYEDDSCVENGYLLDVDSLAHPKRVIRSLVRTADASEFLRASWPAVGPSPAILQANADQRLWFLSARGVYQGEHDGGNGHAHLDDSYADFLGAGVAPGMTVHNVTDGSSATITAITATRVDGALAGGAGNVWDNNDVYFIVCPNWRSEPWVCHSVQLWANARYLSMRGAG